MTDVGRVDSPAEAVNAERHANRRFGCGLILLAALVYGSVVVGAFSEQALFFRVADYREGPRVTATMPWFARSGVSIVTRVGALTAKMFPVMVAGFGLFLILRGQHAPIFARIALILLPIPVVLMATRAGVLLVFYVLYYGHMPHAWAGGLASLTISYAVVLLLITFMWWRVRRRWPHW